MRYGLYLTLYCKLGDEEVAAVERGGAAEDREFDRSAAAGAVGVVVERAGGAVVDQEGVVRTHGTEPQRGEHRMVELDRVIGRRVIVDPVEVAEVAEAEDIRARAAGERIVASAADQAVVAFAAVEDVVT